MPVQPAVREARDAHSSLRYITPFAVFFILLELVRSFPVAAEIEAPLRVVILAVVTFLCWPREISLQPRHALASAAVGLGVFFLWIAPDLLWPGYRASPIFSNAILGHTRSSLNPFALASPCVLAWRTARAVLIVPFIEELFWRAWLMRWLVNSDFRAVPLGTYTPLAFWTTAILFGSEHGPYWDVGLVTGVIYNLWMIRTRSVGDCVLMHAVTNAALSAYVVAAHQWQYWL